MSTLLYFIDIDITVHDGVDGQGTDALHAEFVHDILAVRDDRRQSDVQLIGDFLVDETLHDERHHLNLPVTEDLPFQNLRHGWHVLSMPVCVLLEHQDSAHQLLLGHIDTETVEVGQLRHGVERQGQDDGLTLVLIKEGLVLQHDVHRREIVEVVLWRVSHKLSKRAIAVHRHDGDDVLENML